MNTPSGNNKKNSGNNSKTSGNNNTPSPNNSITFDKHIMQRILQNLPPNNVHTFSLVNQDFKALSDTIKEHRKNNLTKQIRKWESECNIYLSYYESSFSNDFDLYLLIKDVDIQDETQSTKKYNIGFNYSFGFRKQKTYIPLIFYEEEDYLDLVPFNLHMPEAFITILEKCTKIINRLLLTNVWSQKDQTQYESEAYDDDDDEDIVGMGPFPGYARNKLEQNQTTITKIYTDVLQKIQDEIDKYNNIKNVFKKSLENVIPLELPRANSPSASQASSPLSSPGSSPGNSPGNSLASSPGSSLASSLASSPLSSPGSSPGSSPASSRRPSETGQSEAGQPPAIGSVSAKLMQYNEGLKFKRSLSGVSNGSDESDGSHVSNLSSTSSFMNAVHGNINVYGVLEKNGLFEESDSDSDLSDLNFDGGFMKKQKPIKKKTRKSIKQKTKTKPKQKRKPKKKVTDAFF